MNVRMVISAKDEKLAMADTLALAIDARGDMSASNVDAGSTRGPRQCARRGRCVLAKHTRISRGPSMAAGSHVHWGVELLGFFAVVIAFNLGSSAALDAAVSVFPGQTKRLLGTGTGGPQ